jgi:putative ABC transport system ATP-binding protein
MEGDSLMVAKANILDYELAVVCRSVTKAFGTQETRTLALRGIDVDIHRGNMTLLVGPSGCGKTTLISIIAGLLEPTEGEVTVLGHPLHAMRPSELVKFRRDSIGFVFQQYNLLPALNALENASIPLIVQGKSRSVAFEAAREMLSLVGLGDRLHSYPNQLSGGQQQRVAIARALVHSPRLLVCDEPTAALDAHSGRTVMELLRRVAIQQDRAVIVVTHDARVFEFGDRIIHMDDGLIEQITTNADHVSSTG